MLPCQALLNSWPTGPWNRCAWVHPRADPSRSPSSPHGLESKSSQRWSKPRRVEHRAVISAHQGAGEPCGCDLRTKQRAHCREEPVNRSVMGSGLAQFIFDRDEFKFILQLLKRKLGNDRPLRAITSWSDVTDRTALAHCPPSRLWLDPEKGHRYGRDWRQDRPTCAENRSRTSRGRRRRNPPQPAE